MRRKLPPLIPSPPADNGLEGTWVEVHERAARRMMAVDALQPAYRELVYEFNMDKLAAAISHGLKTPDEIREVLEIMQRDGLDKAIVRADQILLERKVEITKRLTVDGRLTRPKL